MRRFIPFLVLFAGCRTPVPAPTLPLPVRLPAPAMPALAPIAPKIPPSEETIRRQAQAIEALMSQNEALSLRLAASTVPPAQPPVAPSVLERAPAPPPATGGVPAPTPASAEPVIVPNAEGVIDVVAASMTPKPGEPVNPFAVRMVPKEGVREVTLAVSGIVAGPSPCAVVNGRLVQAGETVESLVIERVEDDAVLARQAGHLLRLPVSDQPVRVRVAL